MSSFHSNRIVKRGAFLRYATAQYCYDDELVHYELRTRGKLLVLADYMRDIDFGEFRADNSRGWKAHKHRRQWEHKVIAQEKRERNRKRKKRD